jgi:tRNA(Ile)-lysidine synthase
MRQRFQKILKENQLIREGDRVLVALSGGPDSVALLDLLRDASEELRFVLFAAHLDHGMRAESQEDLRFVENLCLEWSIPLVSKRVDVPEIARLKKRGMEETAREIRHQFLKDSACEYQCNVIALGHNRGDQAETLVHRLIRGVGPSGLSAMQVREGMVIRPLLSFSRRQILDYLHQRKISYLVDQSNSDIRFTRNRIRHEVLPLLESFNPQLEKQLFQLSRLVAEDERFWQEQQADVLKAVLIKGDEPLCLDGEQLREVHPALRRRVLIKCLEMVRGDRAGLSYLQIMAVDELLFSPKPHAEINLQGCWVGRIYEKLYMGRKKPFVSEPFFFEVYGEEPVEIPGVGRFQAQLADISGKEDRWSVEFDTDSVKFPLIVRSIKAGDIFHPSGMSGKKKIKDFFIDRKIDRAWRYRIPLVLAGDQIIWVVGMRRSELYRPRPEAGKVMKMTFQPEKAFKNLSL